MSLLLTFCSKKIKTKFREICNATELSEATYNDNTIFEVIDSIEELDYTCYSCESQGDYWIQADFVINKGVNYISIVFEKELCFDGTTEEEVIEMLIELNKRATEVKEIFNLGSTLA